MPRRYHRNCDNCGKEYKGGGERYCSSECAKQHRRNNMKQWWDLTCEFCGKEFRAEYKYRKQRFCSNECRSKNLDKNHPRRILIDITCKGCGKVFKVMPSKSDRQYCSNKCWGLVNKKNNRGYPIVKHNANLYHKYLNLKKRALGKKLLYPEFGEFSKWYIEQEKVCFYCGIPLEVWEALFNGHQNKYSLSIDRKDNNRGYELDNLVLACSKCNVSKNDLFTCNEWVEIAQKYVRPKWQKLLKEDRQCLV